ncbi:MAG TPA: hypothetical protein VFR41_04810, partial [Acidimicrobiia bacterium]|nr:hypothetical protein [Acidimicrobiia bacterium]
MTRCRQAARQQLVGATGGWPAGPVRIFPGNGGGAGMNGGGTNGGRSAESGITGAVGGDAGRGRVEYV